MSTTKPLSGWRALVVDDEFDSRMVASILLQDAGAEVIEAENGQEAWDILHREKPNFVLTDLSMPVMDGWRLMAEINKDRTLSSTCRISAPSGRAAGNTPVSTLAGFSNHITKPLSPDKFIGQLLAILLEFSVQNTLPRPLAIP